MTHHPNSHADLPSLLELAEVVATCIPLLPPAGQKNIGRVVEQMALIAQAGHEWMSIDSAPRDGRPVLLDHPEWHSRVMRGGWDAHETAWRVHGFGCPATQPPAWLPLPPPPKESE